ALGLQNTVSRPAAGRLVKRRPGALRPPPNAGGDFTLARGRAQVSRAFVLQPLLADRARRRRRLLGASSSRSRIKRAGTPPTMLFGGTSRVTTAPAATTDPRPTVTPGRIVTRDEIHTPSSMRIGADVRRPQRSSGEPNS